MNLGFLLLTNPIYINVARHFFKSATTYVYLLHLYHPVQTFAHTTLIKLDKSINIFKKIIYDSIFIVVCLQSSG